MVEATNWAALLWAGMTSPALSTAPCPSPFSASFQRLDAKGVRRSGRRAAVVKQIPWRKLHLDEVLLSTRAESQPSRPGFRDRWVAIWRKRFPEMNPSKHALTGRYRRIKGLEKRGTSQGILRGNSPEARQASNDSRLLSESQTGQVEESLGKRSSNDEEQRVKVRQWKKDMKQGFISELRKMENLKVGDLSTRVKPSLKGIRVDKNCLRAIDELIGDGYQAARTLWNLNCLVYAGAVTVTKHARRFPRLSSSARRSLKLGPLGGL